MTDAWREDAERLASAIRNVNRHVGLLGGEREALRLHDELVEQVDQPVAVHYEVRYCSASDRNGRMHSTHATRVDADEARRRGDETACFGYYRVVLVQE